MLRSNPFSFEYGSLAAKNKSCKVPELWGPPSQAGVGYHVLETTESQLRLSIGGSIGCRGKVADLPNVAVGTYIPRGNDENKPGGYDLGDGTPGNEPCLIRPDVPVLLPLPEPVET